MSWEAVTALSTAATAAVILLTVILGAGQLRATNAQLDHLRMATQLDGTLKIFDELTSPEFVAALRFVRHDLADCLKDDEFRRELERPGSPDYSRHQEIIVIRLFEKIGTLVEHKLIDPDTIFDFNVHEYISGWRCLKPVVDIMRQGTPEAFNFAEALSMRAERWLKTRGWTGVPPITASSPR